MPHPFVHLHVHSEYSLLDGLSKIPKLVERAKALGQPAIALTDHGVMFGTIEFYNEAHKAGIKPIIGIEAYLAPRSRHDREPQKDKSPYHLVLLAQNDAGYRNLIRLASLAQLEGFYYKPRVDKDILAQCSEGIICLSGCGSSEVPHLLLEGQVDKARSAAAWYREIFGPERFFLELQWHGNIPGLEKANAQIIRLARELGLKLAATNDVHYIHADDWMAQDVLLCIGTGSLVSQPSRMRMTDHSYYLKSAEEMAALFGAEAPESLVTPLAIAEMCNVDLNPKGYHLPLFSVPEGDTPESFLRKLCEEGLRERYGARADEPDIRRRLDYELSVIHQMGFDNYFLIVWDLTHQAQQRDIWWNVRGSGAGSIVAYCTGITRLDPLAHHLIFERFLNPGRISMPDIDLDFPDDRRGELIEYAVNKYGQENVAQIITFGTMGARAAVRDVGRALDIPLGEVDGVAKLIPNVPGKPVSIAEAIEQVPELKAKYQSTDYIRELLNTAQKLEGVVRHASTHAAGVIISDKPLIEYAPLHRPTKGSDESGLGIVTQFEMNTCEAIGLLKIDFLGLSTLTIMRRACELIKKNHGVELDLESIPTNDPAAFDLLSRGDVAGVFQVEGAGMRRMLMDMRPTQFEHIVAAISLFRPGPMEYIPTYIRRMHGEEKVEYKHPKLERILAETFGIIVYQEQIIQAASELAGYSPGDADQIRKAVGKKIKEKIEEHRNRFIGGAVKNGLTEQVAASIYDDIEFFARYGFNKAHAADYAIITCQTAYLKAYYLIEYMTALLSVERNNADKVGFLVTECRRMEIPILPPDVDHSELDFSIESCKGKDGDCKSGIRFGLGAIKNVGEGPVMAILEARRKEGPFRNLDDFCRRVDLRQVNRRALESLIKAGAFDSFGYRSQLLAIVDRMLGLSTHAHRARDMGQMTLFGESGPAAGALVLAPLPPIEEASPKEKLAWEKELVGIYLSEHPLSRVMSDLSNTVTTMCGQINEETANTKVVVAGMVTYVRRLTTKKGDPMAFAGLEDLQGSTEVVIFPRLWQQTQSIWQSDKIVLVRGKVDASGKQAKIIADSATDQVSVAHPADEPPAPEAPVRAPQPPRRTAEPSGQYAPAQPEWDAAEPAVPPPPPDWWPEDTQPVPPTVPAPADRNSPAWQGRPEPRGDRPPTTDHLPSADSADRKVSGDRGLEQPLVTRPRRLTVTLQRSGDRARDVSLLSEAHHLLTRYEGRDHFAFRLTGGGNGPIEMDFPNHYTCYSPELIGELEKLLGQGAVRVDMQG